MDTYGKIGKKMSLFKFLFINIYGFLLFVLGVAVFLMPMELFFQVLKIILAVFFIACSVGLFSQWPAKKRLIDILVLRNQNEIRPDTFKKHNKTLCGLLVVSYTLGRLRKTEAFRDLSKKDWKTIKQKALGTNPVGVWRKKIKKGGRPCWGRL